MLKFSLWVTVEKCSPESDQAEASVTVEGSWEPKGGNWLLGSLHWTPRPMHTTLNYGSFQRSPSTRPHRQLPTLVLPFTLHGDLPFNRLMMINMKRVASGHSGLCLGRSLGWEDPLEMEMATHSSILAWRIPWTEEPGGLQSTGLQESDTTDRLTLSVFSLS